MSQSQLQRRDRIIPWYFVMFFAFIALVDGVMVTLAVRTHSGSIIDHPYERGLAYNTVVEAAAVQEKLGWKADIAYAQGALQFTLKDRSGAPLEVEQATATITRPTQKGMDFVVTLTGEKTAVTLPTNGLWEVRVNAVHRGTAYQQSQRIVVP